MKLGDKFTMNVPVRRKWWQVWKPKTKNERRDFTVAHVGPEIIHPKNDVAIWMNCGGIGRRVMGEFYVNDVKVSEPEFNNWLHQSRINGLRASIKAARRNKKKSSHLVAELAELENGNDTE